MTTIINIKSGSKYDIYIGRGNKTHNLPQSKWANPFVIGKDGDRAEVIDKFHNWIILNKPELLNDLHEVDDKILACWCNFPSEDCHGRILIELREQQKRKVKLAVIGSRGIMDKKRIFDFLDKCADRIEMIVSGGCENSPDEIAHEWCKKRGKSILIHYPDCKEEGKKAGFVRNASIIRDCDKVIAFHDGKSKGTLNSLEWASKLNKPSKVIICK